jgi:hypothetical protein
MPATNFNKLPKLPVVNPEDPVAVVENPAPILLDIYIIEE